MFKLPFSALGVSFLIDRLNIDFKILRQIGNPDLGQDENF